MKTKKTLFTFLLAAFAALSAFLGDLAAGARLSGLRLRGAADSELPVIAGLDAIVKLDGKVVAWATNVSFDEDFELQGIRTLGFHGDRGYKSQGYNASVTVGTFTLQAGVDDALPIPTRKSILSSGLVDFELLDLTSGKTLYILKKCKCGTVGVTFDSGSLSVKNTTWRCQEVLPMNVSGIQA